MSTNTALDQIKARVEGHTEGPWHIETDSEMDYEQGIPFSEWPGVLVGPENADPSGWAKKHGETRRIQEVAELSMPDAELIAAAPKLLAALEAVEALHRKVPVYMTEAGDCKHGMDCEGIEVDGESMCPDETEGYTCDHCAEMNTEEYPDYPCSTIKAITEALR